MIIEMLRKGIPVELISAISKHSLEEINKIAEKVSVKA